MSTVKNVKIDAFTTLDLEICSWVAFRVVLCVDIEVCVGIMSVGEDEGGKVCQIFQSHTKQNQRVIKNYLGYCLNKEYKTFRLSSNS